LRHNHSGGHVDVEVSTVDSNAVLTVGNTGPVVLAEETDRLFQPFQRLQNGRTVKAKGVGLGLSIVEAITQAHGRTVVATAPPTGGLVVSVRVSVRDCPIWVSVRSHMVMINGFLCRNLGLHT
jgi:signal transduction histidine kinase